MARLLNYGAESGTSKAFDLLGASSGTMTFHPETADPRSRFYVRHGFGGGSFNLGADHSEEFGGWRYRWEGLSGTNTTAGISWQDSTFTTIASLNIQDSVFLSFNVAGGAQYHTTRTFSTATWYWLEWRYVAHNSAGVFQLKVDGELVLDLSGIDSTGAGTSIRWLTLQGEGTGSNDSRTDDLVVNDTTGSGPIYNRSWPSEVVVALQELAGDGSELDWLGSGMPAAAVGDYDDEIVADTPELFWRLNETVGSTASDSSGNAHDGTYSNATLNQEGITGDGPAVYLTGRTTSTSYVEIASHADLNPTGALTVEAWIRWGDGTWFDSARVICQKHGQYSLRFDGWTTPGGGGSNNGVFYFSVWVGGTRQDLTFDAYTTSPDYAIMNDRGWHHIVGTFDDATDEQVLYIDGLERASRSQAGPLDTTSNVFRVGRGAAGSTFTTGEDAFFDDVAIYSAALSADRVAVHHKAGKDYYELLDDLHVNHSGSTNAYEDMVGNEGVEYISADAAAKELFDVEDVDARFTTVQSVTVYYGMRKAQPSSSVGVRALIKRAGNEASGSTQYASSTSRLHRHTFDRDTTDTSDWSPAKVEAAEFGVEAV